MPPIWSCQRAALIPRRRQGIPRDGPLAGAPLVRRASRSRPLRVAFCAGSGDEPMGIHQLVNGLAGFGRPPNEKMRRNLSSLRRLRCLVEPDRRMRPPGLLPVSPALGPLGGPLGVADYWPHDGPCRRLSMAGADTGSHAIRGRRSPLVASHGPVAATTPPGCGSPLTARAAVNALT